MIHAAPLTYSRPPSSSAVQEVPSDASVPATQTILTDEQQFSQLFSFFIKTDCPTHMPSIIKLKIYLLLMLEDLYKADPQLPSRVLHKPDATLLDLKEECIFGIRDFIIEKNNLRIIRFLEECICSMQKINEHSNDLTDQEDIRFIESTISLFETCRVDLFMRDCQSWNQHKDPLSRADEFRCAVEYCQQVYRESKILVCRTAPKLVKLSGLWVEFSSYNSVNNINILQHNTLNETKSLTEMQKLDICHVFRSLYETYKLKQNVYVDNFGKVSKDLDCNYKAVYAPETYVIIDPPAERENEAGAYDADYVHKHHAVYENFIPRSTEFQTWIASSSNEFLESSLLLRFFPIYLKFGDLDRLKARLEEKKIYHRGKFQSILFEEIKRFSEQFKNDHGLQSKAESFLISDRSFVLWDTFFSTAYDLFQHQVLISEATLGLLLPHADECTVGLFYRPSQDKVLGKNRVLAPSPQSIRLNSFVPHGKAPEDHKLVEVEKGTLEKGIEESGEKEISTHGLFQGVKESTARCLSEVKTKCKGFETEKALNNANAQFAGLLGTMKRLLDHKDEPMSREQFLFLILSMIRHGSLATEQMLSALVRASNNLKKEQLSAHVSSDLAVLLYDCKFPNGDLYYTFRQWINDINYGEILERDLLECSTEGNFVEKLLAKVRYFSQGEVYELEDIVPDLLTYF